MAVGRSANKCGELAILAEDGNADVSMISVAMHRKRARVKIRLLQPIYQVAVTILVRYITNFKNL